MAFHFNIYFRIYLICISQVDRGQLMVYGGFSQTETALDDAWLINTETLSWCQLSGSTGFPRLWHTASTNVHGDILVFGGCENNIMDNDSQRITSAKVLLLRKRPFSLERLCQHSIFKHRSRLQPEWEFLPKTCREWLLQKEETVARAPACTRWFTRSERGLGPGLDQLTVLTKEDLEYPRQHDTSLFSFFFNT